MVCQPRSTVVMYVNGHMLILLLNTVQFMFWCFECLNRVKEELLKHSLYKFYLPIAFLYSVIQNCLKSCLLSWEKLYNKKCDPSGHVFTQGWSYDIVLPYCSASTDEKSKYDLSAFKMKTTTSRLTEASLSISSITWNIGLFFSLITLVNSQLRLWRYKEGTDVMSDCFVE